MISFIKKIPRIRTYFIKSWHTHRHFNKITRKPEISQTFCVLSVGPDMILYAVKTFCNSELFTVTWLLLKRDNLIWCFYWKVSIPETACSQCAQCQNSGIYWTTCAPAENTIRHPDSGAVLYSSSPAEVTYSKTTAVHQGVMKYRANIDCLAGVVLALSVSDSGLFSSVTHSRCTRRKIWKELIFIIWQHQATFP